VKNEAGMVTRKQQPTFLPVTRPIATGIAAENYELPCSNAC